MHFTETEDYKKALEKGMRIVEESSNSNIAQLVPTKSDADLAVEFRAKIIDAYQPIITVLQEMDKYGINMQCNVGKNGLGKFEILSLNMFKVLG